MMRVSAAPAERRRRGRVGAGVAGPAGGNSRDETRQLQAVDSHRADRRMLLC